MIQPDVIRRVRLATCGVHRLDATHEEQFRGVSAGDAVDRITSVKATAFLVRDSVLLTNRHVVELIAREHIETGNHDHWYIEFVYPQTDGQGWSQTFARVLSMFALVDPSGAGALDVGLLTIGGWQGEPPVSPAMLGNLEDVVAGADVAICGFPLGDEILIRGGLWRFGPVVHAGIISAVSPYDAATPRNITSFLTDINTAGGMSGSPVFRSDTGRVVGLHFGGVQGTLGCAVPVDDARLSGWIQMFEAALAQGRIVGSATITGGGDIRNRDGA